VKNVFVLRQPELGQYFRGQCRKMWECDHPERFPEGGVSAASDAVWRIVARLAPGDKETEDFLFRNDSGWPPPAYTLRSEGNRAALRKCPISCFRNRWCRPTRTGAHGKATCLRSPSIPFPETEEGAVDWIGRPFPRRSDSVSDLSGASLATDPSANPDRLAFLERIPRRWDPGRVWVVDTIRALRLFDPIYTEPGRGMARASS
jgi:hypothetical protein